MRLKPFDVTVIIDGTVTIMARDAEDAGRRAKDVKIVLKAAKEGLWNGVDVEHVEPSPPKASSTKATRAGRPGIRSGMSDSTRPEKGP